MSEVYIRSQNKEKLYRLGGNICGSFPRPAFRCFAQQYFSKHTLKNRYWYAVPRLLIQWHCVTPYFFMYRSQNKEKLYRLGGNYACVEYGEYEDIKKKRGGAEADKMRRVYKIGRAHV